MLTASWRLMLPYNQSPYIPYGQQKHKHTMKTWHTYLITLIYKKTVELGHLR